MLKGKQINCIMLMIEGQMTDKEIADEIKVTQKTICEWKKDKEFQNEYANLVKSNLQYAASKAFQKQLSLLNSKTDMIAHLAAKDIMDRAGFKPVDKVEQQVDMDLNITIDYGEE